MIEVSFTTKPDKGSGLDVYTLALNGHADYASIGDDIVCAGASTLYYTAVEHIYNSPFFTDVEEHSEKGYGRIDFIPIEPHEGVQLMKLIMGGFRLLEKSYPQNIRIV